MNKTKLGPDTLLYPRPAVLVGANVDEKPNFMVVACCGIGALKPPAITLAILKPRYTLKHIRENGTFSVNISSSGMAKKTDYCGVYSGKKKDKSQVFKTFYGKLKTAPLIEECPVNLECKVLHLLDMGSHTLIVGEIVETYISDDCLTDGKPDPQKIDPLVFIPKARKYHRVGEFIGPSHKLGKDYSPN